MTKDKVSARSKKKFNRTIADYDDDPKQFKKDMRKLARDLAKAGL